MSGASSLYASVRDAGKRLPSVANDSGRMRRRGRNVIVMDLFLVEGIGESVKPTLENECGMSRV